MGIDKKIRALNHRRIDLMRTIKLWLSVQIFSVLNRYQKAGFSKNILILRMDDKLGDSVTSTGLLRELKKTDAHATITVVCSPASADIFKNLHFIREVYVFRKGILNLLKLYIEL